MIIGLSGRLHSGKDSIGAALIKQFGFKRVAFADGVRELVAELFGWDLKQWVATDDFKREPAVLGRLLGRGLNRITHDAISGRELLQRTGMAARKIFGDDAWIEIALAKCGPQWCERCGNVFHAHEAMGASSGCSFMQSRATGNYVITDVRFPNEVAAIKAAGGKVIRLNCAESLETRHKYHEWCAELPPLVPGACGHFWPGSAESCQLPRTAHPASYSADRHVSEVSLPDDSNDVIVYDAVATGSLEENTAAVLEHVRGWLR